MKNFLSRLGQFILLAVIVSWATVTTLNKVAIKNSTVDSTVIGGTTTAAASFTTVNASGLITGTALNAQNLTGPFNPCGSATGRAVNGSASGSPVCSYTVNGGTSGSVCTTGTGAGATCTTSVSLNTTEADTAYKASCSLTGTATGYPFIQVISKGTSAITVTITNGTASQAVASTSSGIDCVLTR